MALIIDGDHPRPEVFLISIVFRMLFKITTDGYDCIAFFIDPSF